MPAPKTVVKVLKKDGKMEVVYTSDVEKTQYYLFELSRAALRDSGKYIKKVWQSLYDSSFAKKKGRGHKATSIKVWSSKTTQYPRLQIGLKSGKVDGFYAYFQEFGSSKVARLGLLSKAVKDNIGQILEIEQRYLSAINTNPESLIDENDEGDDDD